MVDGGVGVGLGGELVEGGEDEVDAVFVDDVDEGLKVAPVGCQNSGLGR
jgi:hypothetical protein